MQAENRGQWSDERLLAAIAVNDGAAFSDFYRRHLPAVLAYLIRATGDPERAADLAAEVFAAVLIAAPRYRPEGESAGPWVLGIARNKLRESLRRGRVEAKARKQLGLGAIALEDEDLERVEALADQGMGRLAQLVEQLPEEERFAVRSRVIDERSYRDIATELQCSEMVIRKRVSRGLGRIRRQAGTEASP